MTISWRAPDLPIAQDDTTRFLPWLMAFMVFLAALSIAGLFVLADAARTIDRGIENTITIQVPASENLKADEERIAGAITLLKQMPGVTRAEALPRERVVQRTGHLVELIVHAPQRHGHAGLRPETIEHQEGAELREGLDHEYRILRRVEVR